MYLEVLSLCLHQPLKCSQNSSARTSLLLFPQFSSFHVVGRKTQCPLLILHQGKSKHIQINKAVNHPPSPCHQVLTKPPWQEVSAEGLLLQGLCPKALLGGWSPPLPVRAGCLGVSGGVSPCTTPFPWQGLSLAEGFAPGWPYRSTRGWEHRVTSKGFIFITVGFGGQTTPTEELEARGLLLWL